LEAKLASEKSGTMKVLLIEDNQKVVRDLSFCLQVRYPEAIVVCAVEASTGIQMVETESPDLVIVDSSLPDIDLVEVIRRIREFSDVHLITLMEGQTDLERAQCLDTGADDLIIKPFSPLELLARVSALFRRTRGLGFKPERALSLGDGLTINFSTRELLVNGERVKLTPIEYNMLSELARNEGRVLTNRTLLEKVWGSEYTNDPSFVKDYIHRLRSKLEPNPSHPQLLLTERGIGYKFTRHI